MSSQRLTIFNELVTKLQTITGLIPTSTNNTVSIWNSQTIEPDLHKQYTYPHVFIEFERSNYLEPKQITWNTNIKGEQNYILNIVLHIVTKTLRDETDSFSDRDELIELIKYGIKGMEGTNYGPFRLISDDYEKDHGNICENQLIFSTLVQESGIYGIDVDATTQSQTDLALEINKTFE